MLKLCPKNRWKPEPQLTGRDMTDGLVYREDTKAYFRCTRNGKVSSSLASSPNFCPTSSPRPDTEGAIFISLKYSINDFPHRGSTARNSSASAPMTKS